MCLQLLAGTKRVWFTGVSEKIFLDYFYNYNFCCDRDSLGGGPKRCDAGSVSDKQTAI